MFMKIVDYDSGEEIYLIRSTTDPSLTDYYYADNLIVLNECLDYF